MKKNTFRLLLITLGLITMSSHTYAAHMYIESPSTASSNRGDYSLIVFLDPQDESLSAVSADLSFPTDLFEVKTVSTQNGVIPLWLISPHVSETKNFDQRTHIVFEGIVPGGFSGVHSPYAASVYPGIIFTVTLIPKNSGSGDFTLSSIELHKNDEKGTTMILPNESRFVSVPTLSGQMPVYGSDLQIRNSQTISMDISKDSLINNGTPYVYVHESDPSRLVDHIEIAESSKYNPVDVSVHEWHIATNPYVLTNKALTKYVHAKVIYSDKTFAYKTIAPVENSKSFSDISRILLYIIIAIFLLYHYGKNFLHLLPKNLSKRV